MAISHKETHFRIEPAVEADWSWMMQGHVEAVWKDLGSERQQKTDQPSIRKRLDEQVARIRGSEGLHNQAFVARDKDRHPVGFVWVAEVQGEFTGQPEAFVLALYVAEPFRGQDLGRRLMEVAGSWACQRSLQRIALSVAIHNAPARSLYEKLGYRDETLRMSKRL